jgi:hypothetical protein
MPSPAPTALVTLQLQSYHGLINRLRLKAILSVVSQETIVLCVLQVPSSRLC